jgi:hypothetical protein
MEETIESVERQREHLYRQLQEVGDFRRGIISVIYSTFAGAKNV